MSRLFSLISRQNSVFQGSGQSRPPKFVPGFPLQRDRRGYGRPTGLFTPGFINRNRQGGASRLLAPPADLPRKPGSYSGKTRLQRRGSRRRRRPRSARTPPAARKETRGAAVYCARGSRALPAGGPALGRPALRRDSEPRGLHPFPGAEDGRGQLHLPESSRRQDHHGSGPPPPRQNKIGTPRII